MWVFEFLPMKFIVYPFVRKDAHQNGRKHSGVHKAQNGWT